MNKRRIVYVGMATQKVLWRYVATQRRGAEKDASLFTGRGEAGLSADGLTHLIGDLGKRAGIRVWPHLLRHVFATQFLRGGGNVLALSRLLGHVSDALLTCYADIVEANLQAAHAEARRTDRGGCRRLQGACRQAALALQNRDCDGSLNHSPKKRR